MSYTYSWHKACVIHTVAKCKSSAVVDPAVPHRIIKIVQLAIAFECQFEPPLSPLKNNRLFILKLKTGISPDELPKSGHRWIDPPPPF